MKKPAPANPKSALADAAPNLAKKSPSKPRSSSKSASPPPDVAPLNIAPLDVVPLNVAPLGDGGLRSPRSITTIAARTDVGFGNVLFIRGGGPGLSWDSGRPMICESDDLWTFDVLDAEKSVAFKFLINDEQWSTGPDYIVEPGAQLEVTPFF
jgi:hypothetical protein